ncbi:Hsp70 family protein [Streptomyces platensis]|uniref:Hsp70 family protein n=1 Tax=Streptomyces platensis TaxID=58346 RepID=UPI003C3059AA
MVRDATGHRRFNQIIPRNSPLPWSEHKSYTPRRDHERELRLEIWEGDPDKQLTHPDNVQLTELSLKYTQPRPRDESRFELEYTYDTDGLLHVKAKLEHTGEIVVDQEVQSFGSGAPTPEVRKELADLLVGNQQVTLPTAPTLQPQPPAPNSTPAAQRPVPAPPSPAPKVAKPSPDNSPPVLVVDGSNLAWIGHSPRRPGVYESEDRPDFAQLMAARSALASRYPSAQIHMVVDASLRHRVAAEERAAVEAALSKGDIIQPPAGTEGKGDALVAAIADDTGAMVVTNDNYVELQARYPWLRETGRVLGATLTHGIWIFAPRTCVAARRRTGALRT